MAIPRVFVSSTYYDLKHIRERLEEFIFSLGFEPVLFESGDIPFDHSIPLDESCYDEVTRCHILVLIIGGRYGSPASKEAQDRQDPDKFSSQYNSITRGEYERARQQDIPIYTFVEAGVLAEYQTYKRNKGRDDVKYAHVDHVGVFRLLDEILAQRRNNLSRAFTTFDDMRDWLRNQWAGLFATFLSRRSEANALRSMAAQLGELEAIGKSLKTYTESIMNEVVPDHSASIIADVKQQLKQAAVANLSKDIEFEWLRGDPPKTPLEIYDILANTSDATVVLQKLGFQPSPNHELGEDTWVHPQTGFVFLPMTIEYLQQRYAHSGST